MMNEISTVSLFEDCKKLAERLGLTVEFSYEHESTCIYLGRDRSYPFIDVQHLWNYLQGYAKAKGVK